MGVGDITRSILSAWDEEESKAQVEDENEETEETSDEDESTEETDEEIAEPEGEEEEESAEEEEEEETSDEEAEEEAEAEEEEEEVTAFQSDDPEVNAFLAKYQGDIEKALKAEAQQQRLLGQQGQELSVLRRRVNELENELQQATAFNPESGYLSEEQQSWVEGALESGNPRGYVQSAVSAGEYDLARAVCARWAEEAPYEAMRASQQIDQLEQRATAALEPVDAGIPYNDLVGILVQHFPDMPQYEEKMVSTLSALGEQHPLVQDARSSDAEVQARGIIGIYEIARAQTASLSNTKSKLKQQRRQNADNARASAVVSSAQATPSPGETPRSRPIMPGLTLEELDAEFARK